MPAMIDSFGVGDVTIHRVIESESPLFGALFLFPTLTKDVIEQNLSWLAPGFFDPASGNLMLCVESYVVRARHHTILIDSCVGNHKHRPEFPFWDRMTSDRYEKNLAAAGMGVDDIDFVMCTHLHVDHVGWNTRLNNGRWVPTFPRAKYVCGQRELAFWTETEHADPGKQPWIADSVLPIIEAGRVEVVSSDHELSDVVKLIPTPGHTIGHFSVHVGKPGADAIIAGDMVHSPIQVRYPEIGMFADYDAAQGVETRRSLFSKLCDTSTLLCPAHFPSPSRRRLTRWGEGFRYNQV